MIIRRHGNGITLSCCTYVLVRSVCTTSHTDISIMLITFVVTSGHGSPKQLASRHRRPTVSSALTSVFIGWLGEYTHRGIVAKQCVASLPWSPAAVHLSQVNGWTHLWPPDHSLIPCHHLVAILNNGQDCVLVSFVHISFLLLNSYFHI